MGGIKYFVYSGGLVHIYIYVQLLRVLEWFCKRKFRKNEEVTFSRKIVILHFFSIFRS